MKIFQFASAPMSERAWIVRIILAVYADAPLKCAFYNLQPASQICAILLRDTTYFLVPGTLFSIAKSKSIYCMRLRTYQHDPHANKCYVRYTPIVNKVWHYKNGWKWINFQYNQDFVLLKMSFFINSPPYIYVQNSDICI